MSTRSHRITRVANIFLQVSGYWGKRLDGLSRRSWKAPESNSSSMPPSKTPNLGIPIPERLAPFSSRAAKLSKPTLLSLVSEFPLRQSI